MGVLGQEPKDESPIVRGERPGSSAAVGGMKTAEEMITSL
jgi:hypothetical protein